MTMTDPIADLLTRIRNGQRACKQSVVCPYSIEKEGLVKVLQEEGYIRHYQVENAKTGHKELKIELKYHENQLLANLASQSHFGSLLVSIIDTPIFPIAFLQI